MGYRVIAPRNRGLGCGETSSSSPQRLGGQVPRRQDAKLRCQIPVCMKYLVWSLRSPKARVKSTSILTICSGSLLAVLLPSVESWDLWPTGNENKLQCYFYGYKDRSEQDLYTLSTDGCRDTASNVQQPLLR